MDNFSEVKLFETGHDNIESIKICNNVTSYMGMTGSAKLIKIN